MKKTILIIGLGLLLFISCTREDPCIEPTTAYLNIGFYHLVNGAEEDTTLIGLSVHHLPAGDTILYDSVSAKAISLPLSQLADYSRFVFTFSIPQTIIIPDTVQVVEWIGTRFVPDTISIQDTFTIQYIPVADTIWVDSVFQVPSVVYHLQNDTVQFAYTRELYMISKACGFTHYSALTDILNTNYIIGNIQISDAEINLSDEENIKIFF